MIGYFRKQYERIRLRNPTNCMRKHVAMVTWSILMQKEAKQFIKSVNEHQLENMISGN